MVRYGLVLLLVALLISPTLAYSRGLSKEDIQAAIDFGKSRKGQDLVTDDSPHIRWFREGFSGSYALIVTPWLQVASAARTASAKYQDLSETEAQAIVMRWAGRLQVLGSIVYNRENFWRDAHAVIMQSNKIIQPTTKTSSFDRVVSCSARPCTMRALMVLEFQDSSIDPLSEASMVFVLSGGYQELKTTFDLSKLR